MQACSLSATSVRTATQTIVARIRMMQAKRSYGRPPEIYATWRPRTTIIRSDRATPARAACPRCRAMKVKARIRISWSTSATVSESCLARIWTPPKMTTRTCTKVFYTHKYQSRCRTKTDASPWRSAALTRRGSESQAKTMAPRTARSSRV